MLPIVQCGKSEEECGTADQAWEAFPLSLIAQQNAPKGTRVADEI
jgi:hypothetical protein